MNKAETKKVIIIGAGPGGLSAAMILAFQGFQVTIVERNPYVGGRNSALKAGDYTFELGPTFIMLPNVFRETFAEAGLDMNDYVQFQELDPMYQLHYADGRVFKIHYDKPSLEKEIERLFPGESAGYRKYLREQKIQFERLYRCLTVPYLRWYNYLRAKLLKALPVIGIGKSVYDMLCRYFKAEDLKIAMAFQAKYLGMSPWKCPGGFSILSYVEHAEGIHHARGGVHMISEGMAKAARDLGVEIRLSAPVKEIVFSGRRASGVLLESGEVIEVDAVIMNADFAYGMSHLVPAAKRRKYSDKKLAKKDYSCSTFMLYLGVKRRYDLAHHNIFFSKDYRHNVEEIYESKTLPADPSFYVQNACITDASLAPEGKSTLYLLVPVPNLTGSIDWQKEAEPFKERLISLLETRAGLTDLRQQIEVERVVTPLDWRDKAHVYNGAVFNLAHSLDQMLYLRPRNRLEGYDNLYIVGGGTHPGSGLPTILESGRIAARLVDKELR